MPFRSWHDFSDKQTPNVKIGGGIPVSAEIRLVGRAYVLSVWAMGRVMSRNLTVTPVAGDGPLVNVYFVLEHQPQTCAQLPPSGSLSYTDIEIEFGGKRVVPNWTAHVKRYSCSSRAVMVNATTVKIVWDPNGSFV